MSKNKRIPKIEVSNNKEVREGKKFENFYDLKPSWVFSSIDKDKWSLDKDISDTFWDEILPRMKQFEFQTWSEILLKAKSQNHSIAVNDLNLKAQRRLIELRIEPESIYSLRVQGKHRIYGFINCGVFNIVWVDLDHGDNLDCVCRSRKKHT